MKLTNSTKTIKEANEVAVNQILSADQVDQHIQGGVINETMLRLWDKAFGTTWGMTYSFKTQNSLRAGGSKFEGIRPRARIAGRTFNMWATTYFNSVVISEKELKGLTPAAGVAFPLFFWDQLETVVTSKLGEVRNPAGEINLLSSYYVIGAMVGKSLFDDRTYTVPFRALRQQEYFLGLFNSKLPAGDKKRKNLKEQEVIDLAARSEQDRRFMANSVEYTCPATIELKDKFGHDPLLSSLTLVILKSDMMEK